MWITFLKKIWIVLKPAVHLWKQKQKSMEKKRFNLVLNEEQIDVLLLAIECLIDNEEQSEDGNQNSIDVLKKLENRLRKNY